ncbi:hypothetical protein [Mumia quercus]|uniref:hypothetical protein n=1 Tax=Mumia quercus TaxID=2976125 RepID=UPI0021D2B1F6|nr:hypothetical protein [Mumia quercus]
MAKQRAHDTSTHPVPGAEPRSARLTGRIVGPLVVSAVVLLFALPVAWLLAYFMNDEVHTADHAVFLSVPTVELLVAGLVSGLVIGRSSGLGYARTVPGALALVFVPALVLAVVYAVLSLTPVFDDAIGHTVSGGVWAVVAGVAALGAFLLTVLGIRLLQPER